MDTSVLQIIHMVITVSTLITAGLWALYNKFSSKTSSKEDKILEREAIYVEFYQRLNTEVAVLTERVNNLVLVVKDIGYAVDKIGDKLDE